MRFYIGTYSRAGSRGIYSASFNPETGAITVDEAYGAGDDPSFVAVDAQRQRIFAVSETGSYEGRPEGSVASFRMDARTGALNEISRQPSGGGAPAHVCADPDGRFILVANYNGGNVAMLPVDGEGRLMPRTSLMQHKGSSAHPERQTRPHAHSITLDPAGRFATALDLGTDELVVYEVDADALVLRPADPPSFKVQAGSGPRHMAFHPDSRRAYVINELASTVTTFAYDGERGAFEEIQTISTLPANFSGQNTCAEIQFAPSGDFLFASNRGHDTIAAFAVDPDSGGLSAVGHASTGGRTPRSFAVDPTGRFIVAANQDSNSLVVLAVDSGTGTLTPTGQTASVPAPVCVRFLELPGA